MLAKLVLTNRNYWRKWIFRSEALSIQFHLDAQFWPKVKSIASTLLAFLMLNTSFAYGAETPFSTFLTKANQVLCETVLRTSLGIRGSNLHTGPSPAELLANAREGIKEVEANLEVRDRRELGSLREKIQVMQLRFEDVLNRVGLKYKKRVVDNPDDWTQLGEVFKDTRLKDLYKNGLSVVEYQLDLAQSNSIKESDLTTPLLRMLLAQGEQLRQGKKLRDRFVPIKIYAIPALKKGEVTAFCENEGGGGARGRSPRRPFVAYSISSFLDDLTSLVPHIYVHESTHVKSNLELSKPGNLLRFRSVRLAPEESQDLRSATSRKTEILYRYVYDELNAELTEIQHLIGHQSQFETKNAFGEVSVVNVAELVSMKKALKAHIQESQFRLYQVYHQVRELHQKSHLLDAAHAAVFSTGKSLPLGQSELTLVRAKNADEMDRIAFAWNDWMTIEHEPPREWNLTPKLLQMIQAYQNRSIHRRYFDQKFFIDLHDPVGKFQSKEDFKRMLDFVLHEIKAAYLRINEIEARFDRLESNHN